MSIAIQNRSRGVSVKRPSRSSAAANATECTSRSSSPPNASPTSPKTRAISSSERTSRAVTRGLPTDSARSRTDFSIRSPWKVNASCAPPSASRFAIAHAIDRRLATPRISPRLPAKIPIGPASLIRVRNVDVVSRALRSPNPLLIAVLAAAVLVPAAAGATPSWQTGLKPIYRPSGELTLPRLRAGKLAIPAAHVRGRVRVIVRLSLPPLARAQLRGTSTSSARKLDVRSSSSQAYLARLARQQDAAVAALKRAVPQARVQERFRILLNGF